MNTILGGLTDHGRVSIARLNLGAQRDIFADKINRCGKYDQVHILT